MAQKHARDQYGARDISTGLNVRRQPILSVNIDLNGTIYLKYHFVKAFKF
jgi:hypothetical protein